MKKIIALLFMLPILFAYGDKNTPDTPPAPNPNPNPPNPPVVVTSPPRVRGFMVQTANGLHPQTIKDLSTWGANVIRLQLNPATYALKKGKDLWETLPEYLNLVEEKVRAAQSVNVKVILDLHEPPIYVNGKVPTLDDHNQRGFWANHPEMKDALIRMWKNIAQHFTKKEYENEIWGYDLFNEPSEKGRAAVQEWLAMVPDIITAIRTVNKNVWIVFQPGLVAETFQKEKKKIIQKDKRVVYSLHFYCPETFACQGILYKGEYNSKTMTHEEAIASFKREYPGKAKNHWWEKEETYCDKATLEAELKPLTNFASEYKVPVLIGEFSVITWAPVNSAINWFKDVIDIFEKNNFSWCFHAFREWQGWSLESPEGLNAFWFSREKAPAPQAKETQRAKYFKDVFKRLNKKTSVSGK